MELIAGGIPDPVFTAPAQSQFPPIIPAAAALGLSTASTL